MKKRRRHNYFREYESENKAWIFQACTGFETHDLRDTGAEVIAEVMGSNPVQTQIFFRPYFRYCSSSVYYCEDHFHIHAFIYSSNIWLNIFLAVHNYFQQLQLLASSVS